jgi:hypothetical protein
VEFEFLAAQNFLNWLARDDYGVIGETDVLNARVGTNLSAREWPAADVCWVVECVFDD